MDILVLGGMAMIIGIVFLAMGLSYISQSLAPMDYNSQYGKTGADYYANPLNRFNSKWFHYRPKGSVIISKEKWAQIERDMGVKLNGALETGKKLGKKEMLIEIEDKIDERRAKLKPSSPYALFNIKATASIEELRARYEQMRDTYNPDNFAMLDDAFIELAKIRSAEIEKAWKQISYGVRSTHGDI